ncbi:MAG: LysR family transcriptional regulator [Rhodospirillales bacterium]|nr:LysR family transcriptional regulator [Rhodospirillales bacterium]
MAKEAKKRQGGLSLTALRVFAAVVDSGSFSRAAETLGMSQPNVSFQVVNLEQACGVRLLQRRQPVSLTDAGRDLFVRARLILSRVDEFESSVRDLRDLQRGRLTIGFSSPAAALGLIAVFLRAHPGIEVATALGNTESLLADIQNCRIDVGIMTLTEPRPALTNTLIAEQHLVACLPRRHRLARADAISLAELAGEPLVVREPGSMTQQLLDRVLAERGLAPPVRLRVASREALKEAVAQGIGLGAVLHDEAGSDLRLRIVPITGIAVRAGIYAVSLNESIDLPAVAAFVALAAKTGVAA